MTSLSVPLDEANPFASPSRLPYQLPDFARVRPQHFAPAIRAGMAQHRQEIEQIASNRDPATIENTVEALERSGQLLDRAVTVLFNQLSSDTNDTLDEIEEKLTPELSAHHDFIAMEPRLFARVTDLLEKVRSGQIETDAATQRLVAEMDKDFRRAGVGLSLEQQDDLRFMNSRISTLEARFGRLLQAATNEACVVFEDVTDLDGLSQDAIASASQAASDRGQPGKYAIELQLPTQQGALSQLTQGEVRQQIHAASVTRGLTPGETDTRPILLELATLRARKAQMLGFEHHAAFVADEETARSTPAIMGMLAELAPKAITNARREAVDLKELAERTEPGLVFGPADWAFYAERLRGERFSLDDSVLRPFLELDRVLHDGVFAVAAGLYGMTMTSRPDLVGYHPDVRIWEVFDADGAALGLFLGDFFARESKSGGAWMNNLVDQSTLLDELPVVVNNLNIPKPPSGEPALLTWDEVITLFHEFGHALHGLLSRVRYPSQSGTNVPRDFVEFPSQVNEMWAWDSELLSRFAVHHGTGEPMPREWIDTLVASRQFNEGFATTEYLAAALLDQAWHQLGPDGVPTSPEQVVAFEQEALAAQGLDFDLVPPRYRSSYFKHVFAGGYSAGYYGYIWSEVLDAETVEWFTEEGGLRRENGEAFRRAILEIGDTTDPVAAFTAMRGHAPRIEPLLTRRGLNETVQA